MTHPRPPKTVVAFFAHPDDAEIFCGGTLIRLSQLGYAVHVVTAAAGDCGTMTLSPDAISAIRRKEAETAVGLIGGEYHWLGEMDGKVSYRPESIQRAVDLFRRINPTLVFTHPRHDYMPDHEQVHLLARMASFLFTAPNASATVPVPENAHIPHLYFNDPLGGADPYTGQMVPAATLVDVTDVHPMKLHMLACHTSQREWLRAHHGMDEYLDATARRDAVRGGQIGVAFAENFTIFRGSAYPTDDLLERLFNTPTGTK